MATLRPKLIVEPEMRFYQIDEPWLFEATLKEADTPNDWEPDTSGATITITHSGDGALSTAVADVAMTIAGNVISYTLATGIVTVVEKNLKVTIDVTQSPDTFTLLHMFDAVKFSPRMAAGISDVATAIPSIGTLYSPSDPDGQDTLREAWGDILRWLKSQTIYPQFIINALDLKDGHVYKTRELLYGNTARDESHAYHLQMLRWREAFADWKQTVKLDVDVDESGTIEADEEMKGSTTVSMGRRVVR